jgi:uncharacterized protein (UPF0305 family)
MKYLITENRLIDFVDKYLKDTVGELKKVELNHINATEGDFEIVDENMETVFRYMDYHLGVEENLFYYMMNLFGLDKRETEKLLEKWFNKHYPDDFLISAFPIIE